MVFSKGNPYHIIGEGFEPNCKKIIRITICLKALWDKHNSFCFAKSWRPLNKLFHPLGKHIVSYINTKLDSKKAGSLRQEDYVCTSFPSPLSGSWCLIWKGRGSINRYIPNHSCYMITLPRRNTQAYHSWKYVKSYHSSVKVK